MAFKTFLVICASALFVQSISAQGQCNNANARLGSGYALNSYSGLGTGSAGVGLGGAGMGSSGLGYSSSGGGLTVSSVSPIAPTGLYIVSENVIKGPVTVSGVLPFLTAVALEGEVSSDGSAGIQYSCGNGNIGIVSENMVAPGNFGVGTGLGVGYGAGVGLNAGYGLGAPLVGAGVSSPCTSGRVFL